VARAPKYDDEMILTAMAEEVTNAGLDGASVSNVAARLGAPSGSIYHRFPTRKHLLGSLWVRTVRSFHDSLETSLDPPADPLLAGRVVDSVFGWIEHDPVGAALLLRFRTEDLIDNEWPTEIRVDIAEENQRLADMINRVAEVRQVNPLDVVLALVDFPSAAARRAGVFDNEMVTEAIRQRTKAVLEVLLAPPA
jgi:AcrR family transcriptional regulator